MSDTLIFSKEDWLAAARKLMPNAPETLLVQMWLNVERLDEEHERALAAGRKWMIENI